MSLLQLREASKVYPEQTIFSNISLQIQKRDRVGLIGANGTGKSTLFRVLSEREYLDSGELMTSNDLEIGYLEQSHNFSAERTLYQEMLSIFDHLFDLEAKLAELESKMGEVSGSELDKVMQRYSRLRQEFEEEGGYQYESRIKGVLRGLGFSSAEFEARLSNFSGGEKTRALLAKLLLQEPELLLLDEPTNHLDFQAKEWLEDYLVDYPGAVVIISHDRYFLDQVVNRIWELEKGRLEKYSGDYSFYLEEKEQRVLTWQREYEQQQKKIKKMKAYIRKNKAGVDAKQARGRQKKLERMEKIPPPPQLDQPKIEFARRTTSGREVLEAQDLTKSYAEEEIITATNFKLYRGEKVALVGANGSGKTTLFKILAGVENPDSGQVQLGAKVKLAYYDQEHQSLTSDYNLIQELQKVDDVTTSYARDVLARFLFKGDDVFKEVSTLSGGEKARLSLAKLSIQDFNLLLLDEPTNHLDIKSKEILESALEEYSGTVLIISHDRYFLDQFTDRVLAIEGAELKEYRGNYSDYRQQYQELLAAQKEAERQAQSNQQSAKNKQESDDQQEEIDCAELEAEIMELEDRLSELEEQFESKELYEDQEELAALSTEYENLEEQLEHYYQLWEEVI
ncbi:MAG: ATP-binding cassette domain-containing protein [Bacillota bacterium]